jgi:hypothetical protein
MKKILPLVICFLIVYGTNAQLQKGNFLVGGSVRYTTSSEDDHASPWA